MSLTVCFCLTVDQTAAASGPTSVVTSADEMSLRTAISAGGWIGLEFNGTVALTNTVNITNNVILDATGFSVTISGGNAVRIFYVANGASLTVSNLTLADGSCLVTNGILGTPADGGAIYNDQASVNLVTCILINNNARSLIYGGVARGGAIFNNGGIVYLNECIITSNFVVGGGPNSRQFTNSTVGTALGGVIYNTNGAVTFMRCDVNGNSSSSWCAEGGIYTLATGLAMGGATFQSSGSTLIAESSFVLNQAIGGSGFRDLSRPSPAYGGAIAASGGSLTI